MLFARWQHHLRFCSGFPYAPLKAMATKISKWSRIQDSFRITPKNWTTGSFCHSRHAFKISERSVHNFLSYLADTQTNRQTKSGKNITSLAEVIIQNLVSPDSVYEAHRRCKIRLQIGFCPEPRRGSLRHSPRLRSWIKEGLQFPRKMEGKREKMQVVRTGRPVYCLPHHHHHHHHHHCHQLHQGAPQFGSGHSVLVVSHSPRRPIQASMSPVAVSPLTSVKQHSEMTFTSFDH